MRLYILRHAEAVAEAESDHERVLTTKGQRQGRLVGRFLDRCSWRPDVVLSSPVVRARQTAQLVARSLGTGRPVIEPWLACGMVPESAYAGLGAYGGLSSVLLVGHEPDLGVFLSSLLGQPGPSRVRVRKASLAVLDLVALRPGGGILQAFVPAKAMG